MRYGTIINRENLIEKEFIVKVAYPKDLKDKENITEFLIYNMLCGGKNYIECDVKEIKRKE